MSQPPADPAGEVQPLSASRRCLRLLGLLGTLLVLGLSAAYAWQSRQQQIDEAAVLAHRHVARLAADLAQTLAVGDAVIQQAEARLAGLAPGREADDALAALGRQQQPLLAALPIPMRLLAHDAGGPWLGDAARRAGAGPSRIHPPAPMAGGSVEIPAAGAGPESHQLLLARAAAPNVAGVAAFSVALQRVPLLRSFEAVRHQPGGSVALLRVEPAHRGITVLARVPAVEGATGRLIQGPLQCALPAHRMGWLDDIPQIDEVRRVMAYQRLDGQAESLLLIYSLRTDDVLQAWHASLPWLARVTCLLLLAVLGGLTWLDRALRRLESALAALGQSEARLRTLADNLPDVVLRVDRDLRPVFANPAVHAAIGLRPAQLMGRTLAEMGLCHQAEVATWTQALGRVFSTGQTERLEFDLPGLDGLHHWESKLVPELRADGQVQSALVIGRDVSDRVRHAEALALSELRFRLAATHGQVWEWDLAIGQVQIPAVWWQSLGHPVPPVAQMLQAFEAILHPDDHALWHRVLRDHLRHGSIVDVTDRHLAEDAVRSMNADLEDRVRHRTAQLQASEARLQRINSELETVSYSVSHDLKAPLRGIEGYSQLLLRDHAAALDEEAQGFLARIRAATQQMGQLIDDLLAYSQLERRNLSKVALRNLVDNALKFGRPGVPLEVVLSGSRCATPSGEVVRLTVQDNGIGFDMKFGERILGIFQRLHRAELYPGTGVGLAIVRKAMDRMGGQAGGASGPGPDAIFNLDMPVA